MAIYAKKYNKNLKKWEIVSPTSDNDVVVLNENYTESGTPVTLNHTLSQISGDIEKLQRNVSWLAEHGGGGGGYGTGSTNNYGITVTNNGLNNNQLYVSSNSFKISFRITGGTATDSVQYRCTYDGNYLNNNYTKISANEQVNIEISDVEKYSKITPHTFIIEAIDPDGMTIPSYKLNIVETSIVLDVAKDNMVSIGGVGALTVSVTNKILNSRVSVSVKNITTNSDPIEQVYDSNSTAARSVDFNFFGEDGLIDSSSVKEGDRYNFTINAQATLTNGTYFNAEEITAKVLVTGSSSVVIVLNELSTEDEFDKPDETNKKQVSSNGYLSFGFTPYYSSNTTSVYYAIRLRQIQGKSEFIKQIVGNFDDYKQGNSANIGELKSITTDIDENFIPGKVLVDIICWSADGGVHGTVTGAFKLIPANNDEFKTQVPIRGNDSTVGNAMYASWGKNEFSTSNVGTSNAESAKSATLTYLPVGSKENSISSGVTMNVYGTNGEVNGFMSESGSAPFLRLSNDAYATVDISGEKNDINTWADNDGFTISVTFKSDYHPYNDRTIFFMGKNNKDNSFQSGLKIDLEKVYWYFEANGVGQHMEVNIKQNVLTTVDFVYIHKTSVVSGQTVVTGMAKIYVNGIINAAKEANSFSTKDLPNKIYLGCNVLSDGKTIWNNADINIYNLRIFNKYLNDIEVVVNSHNDRAKRGGDGTIDSAEYDKWKRRNYLSTDEGSTIVKSSLYGLSGSDYTYFETVGYQTVKGDNPPLPIVFIDGSQHGFIKEKFFSTNLQHDVVDDIKTGLTLIYYDPEKKKQVNAEEIGVSIQGTSSTTYRSKNLELYFKKKVGKDKNNNDKFEMFQPKDTWFPESEFTLKADVVDSAHANNATIGKWINEYGANSVLEPNPAMKAASEESNKPFDILGAPDKNGNPVIDSKTRQEKPTVKHTLEGFPVIVLMTFYGDSTPTFLGIYSFNLGRYSYFNMGFNFLKYFSRRKKKDDGTYGDDEGTPALVDTYEAHDINDSKDKIIKYNGGEIDLSKVYSFEFGSDADDNLTEHPTWSQDDLTVIAHLGEFKYNGNSGDHSSQPPLDLKNPDWVWTDLKNLFHQTASIPPVSKVYTYDSISDKFSTNGGTYADATEVETFARKLSIKNAYGYFVIAMAFGMVDSLGKNMTLRTWGDGKWYPAFYDMDTALGLTNAGEETVPTNAYIDSFNNQKTTDGPNTMIVTRNDPNQNNSYGAFNSKLWNILRATSDELGNKSNWAYMSKDIWTEGFYGEFWRKLRDYSKNEDGTAKGPLSSPDSFISLFTAQTKDVGEMIYNDDFTVKYLTKYKTTGEKGTFTYGNIQMLHGTRTEYIRSWLKDRFCFLDGVLLPVSSNDITDPYPYFKTGYITCGGPNDNSGYPKFTISTTSPTIFTANIGQNGQLSKWFIPAYKDTMVILPQLSSDSKRITINSTSIITKLDGLKYNTFQKFERMELPSLSEIDLDSVESLVGDTPVNFSTTFIDVIDGKKVSNVRKIDLRSSGGEGVSNFPVTLYNNENTDPEDNFNYWKVNSIDISNSSVNSLVLPSSPLSNLDVTNSQIISLNISNQPYLADRAFNFNGCNQLTKITINNCRGLKNLKINSMNALSELKVSNCTEIQSIVASANTQLTLVTIEKCANLTSLNLDGCNNENLQITIVGCDKLEKVILPNLKTTKPIIMANNVGSIKTLDLTNSTGLDGFKFGLNESVLQYKEENVLDLSAFSGLASGVLKMQNMNSVKYVKFANIKDEPFPLGSSFFNGCVSLKKVFGNIELKGNAIFNGCKYFSIHDLPEGDEINVPNNPNQFDESDDGFVTNVQIGTNSLSYTFSKTSCNLYDVYYILQKCDNVTDIYDMFSYVTTIKTNTGKNSLKAEAFSHCGKVTNMGGLFYSCGFTTRIPSPILDSTGKVTSNGIFQYMPNLTGFTQTFNGNTVYADDNLFHSTQNGTNLSIEHIAYFSPIFVKDANSQFEEGKAEKALAKAGKLFRYMPDLNSIDHSFNGASIYFSHRNEPDLTDKGMNFYSTDIFYNTPNLKNINDSFTNLTACGYIRNIFGGYESTSGDSKHFPSKITAVTNSFSVSTIGGNDANNIVPDGEKNMANVYIGDSFLANISSSIVYLGDSARNGTSPNNGESIFYGNFTKYADTPDVDDAYVFPSKVLLNCRNLKEAPGFFSRMKRPSGSTESVLTLPYYKVGKDDVSMFKDAVSLTNFAYGFSNLQLPFKLKGFGFSNATNLNNVTGLFKNSNLQGQVPYGLFYREATGTYPSMKGLTYDDANAKNIHGSDYGVENLLISGGQVKVEFDNDGKITASKSEPFTSGGTIYYMDDYGVVCTATSGDNKTTTWTDSKNVVHSGSTDDIKNPVDPTDKAISAFTGSYKTYIRNITRIDSIFSGIKSTGLTAYSLSVTSKDLTIENYKLGSSICNHVIEDNPNYNPIFVRINESFDPWYYHINQVDGTKTVNKNYDPRRVIVNSAYDKYPKIWNKWINDGTSTLYTAIINSDIYKKIGKDGDIGISSGLPDDISSTSVNSVTTLSLDEEAFPNVVSDINDIKVRQQTRNYFVAGDLFRYCEDYATIYSAFQGSGGNNYDTPDTGWPNCLLFGFYGSIPPFFFENVRNTTSLANMFSGVKGLTPYSWAQDASVLGDMFPPDLLKGMGSLTGVSRMFESCYIYPNEQIPESFFETNSKLKNLSYLFYDCKFDDKNTDHYQVPKRLFNNCSQINDISYMFYKGDINTYRAPWKMESELFTPKNNPVITNVEYFMYYASNTKGTVPEFWKFSNIKKQTHAYYNVKNVDNYPDIVSNKYE